MRADGHPRHQDFPWRAVIRSEMETWNPTGLPARFQPRGGHRLVPNRPALQRAVLPLAAAALLLLALATFARTPAPSAPVTIVQVLGRMWGASTPTPPAAVRPRPAQTGVLAQPRSVPMESATATAAAVAPAADVAQPAPSAESTPSATPEPQPSSVPTGLLQLVLPQPEPTDSPAPSPSPTRLCLPLFVICL